jgi:sec-independent protein translocase protein TatA
MGSFSIWHWLIVLVVVLILFGGRGKVSQLMGDFGKGLKSFKQSMREDAAFEEPERDAREPKALPPEKVVQRPEAMHDHRAERDPATRL